jgi:hypothetical protein
LSWNHLESFFFVSESFGAVSKPRASKEPPKSLQRASKEPPKSRPMGLPMSPKGIIVSPEALGLEIFGAQDSGFRALGLKRLQSTNLFQHLVLITQLPHPRLPLPILALPFLPLPLQLGLQVPLTLFEAPNLSSFGEGSGFGSMGNHQHALDSPLQGCPKVDQCKVFGPGVFLALMDGSIPLPWSGI